ncbi:hypothetical protein OIU79_001061 [Salix purpurea]|uniref:Uncharacterized protein n=1 Tax=Salix purpurea TaxID=77065 RepID=A0A9Q0ZNL6_SALPP|nr:hypothetical protein OIU79_001061 [Salix purpurea]
MEQVIERRNLHPKNTDMSGQPSHELQAREGRRPTRIEPGRTPETRKIIGNKLVSCRRRKGDGFISSRPRPLLEPDKSSDSYIRSMSSDDPRQEYNSPCMRFSYTRVGLSLSFSCIYILVLTDIKYVPILNRESLSSSSF